MSLELRSVANAGVAMQGARSVGLTDQRLTVGSLASNSLIIGGPGVEPLHCLIERDESGVCRIVDLGTLQGVRINGHLIEVEAVIVPGDRIEIGTARLELSERLVERVRPSAATQAQRASETVVPLTSRAAGRLFKPTTSPGRYLEVVAYWGDTVLNVDHFHPTLRGMGEVTIGDPTKAHFPSGGRDFYKSRVLAEVEDQSCVLKLDPEMSARVRKNGHLRLVDGQQRMELGPRDYAHVVHGPIRYFLHFAEPPAVELPRDTRRDKLFTGLLSAGFVIYLALVAVALLVSPKPIELEPRDVWQTVYVDPTPTPKIRQPSERREVKIVEIKPEPMKAAAATTERKALPNKQASATQQLRERPKTLVATIPQPAATKGSGQIQGPQKASRPGVDAGTREAPSFANLSKLGGGLGRVLNQPGGTSEPFRSSPGGQGVKSGSSLKDYGLDGAQSGARVALPGSSDRALKWGSGDGLMDGKGKDKGGLKDGFGPRFGHVPGTDIYVPPQDIVTSSWDSSDAIRRVISSHLNEIRHCYEQLLARSPQASGKLKVRFVIGLNGRVTTTGVVDSTVSDTIFRGCVTGRIARWSFEPLRGTEPLTVTYPFVFTPL